MIPLVPLATDILRELSKIITGKLLTEEQIQNISSDMVGKYFADWLPTPQGEAEAEKRIDSARSHITEATKIVNSLQNELEEQAKQLDILAKEIEEKREISERYAVLAQANQDTLAAFRTELEETVRKELTAQVERRKNLRRFVSLTLWIITLVLGAALGAYLEISFEPIFQTIPK